MAIRAHIKSIEIYLPEQVLTNDDLSQIYGEWSALKIEDKTGIQERRIAREDECSSDMAVKAAERVFAAGTVGPADIDYVLFCTQSPDYFLPTTACTIQHRLGLPTTCGALDFNLGCSGFVYGLGLAKGLIETGQAKNILLLTSETYSKFIHPMDKSVRTIFGDGAAATLIQGVESDQELIGPFVYGTDGNGARNLIVATGGMRQARISNPEVIEDNGNHRTINNLYMNGVEVFNFTLRAVPQAVRQLLGKTKLEMDDVKMFIFHQANRYMLESLRKKINISPDKFPVDLSKTGNTVSSTLPIMLEGLLHSGKLRGGDLAMLVGFGVGYSWGAVMIRHVE
jgi:3-oxoacyl-[acyl-carrier-protein] synthase-3